MKVFAFTNDGQQERAEFNNSSRERTIVKGWITEAGDVIFTSDIPSYCPYTGEKLEFSPPKVRITLEISYDPTKESHPSEWDWQEVIDSADEVIFIDSEDI
jgi:hypothetical protein